MHQFRTSTNDFMWVNVFGEGMPIIPEEYEHVLWHRDFFIMSPPNMEAIVDHFKRQHILTELDIHRLVS